MGDSSFARDICMIYSLCNPMSVQTACMGPAVFGLCSYGLQFFPLVGCVVIFVFTLLS